MRKFKMNSFDPVGFREREGDQEKERDQEKKSFERVVEEINESQKIELFIVIFNQLLLLNRYFQLLLFVLMVMNNVCNKIKLILH